MAPQYPILLYDGVCNLCNASVRFVIRHDRCGCFLFASQQSPAGQELIRKRLPDVPELSTMILLTEDAVYTQSFAIIEICARLDPPWPRLAPMLRLIPSPLRDALYRFLVRNRYRWFGRTETCQVAPAEFKSRFLG